MIPVVLISFLYNLPKFFELSVEEVESYEGIFYHLSPTALRYKSILSILDISFTLEVKHFLHQVLHHVV